MFWSKFRDRFIHLRIILLDSSRLDYECKASATGQEVLDYVLDYLNLTEREYFGLRYLDANDQVHWLDINRALKKQLKKCGIPYVFYFCVKFYAPDPAQLQEEVTRFQFFIQIWQDINHGRLPVPLDSLAELGACALQFEMGDYDPDHHGSGYAAKFDFGPQQPVKMDKKIEDIHKGLRGLSAAEAQYRFLTYAKCLPLYGADLHPVLGERDISDPYTTDSGYFLGLSPSGITMVHSDDKLCEFLWEKIASITKDVRSAIQRDRGGSIILRIRDEHDKISTFGFRLATRDACKHLWKTALEQQKFFRNGVKSVGATSTPSLASRLMRFGSKFRLSSRSGSDSVSLREPRRAPQIRSKPELTQVIQKSRAPDTTVIYEDDKMTVILENGDVRKQLKMPLPENDRVPDLQPRNVIVNRSIRRATTAIRSSSPMSIQSSFSTTPRRIPEYNPEDDADSVFSGSSRVSRAVSDAETLRKKRKRSTRAENNSSGASEENELVRQPEIRSSLGPQRRKGKMHVRHRTVDGHVTQQILSQMRTSPCKSTDGRGLNLPDRLAEVMQSARSLNYLNTTGLSPRIYGTPQMFCFTGEGSVAQQKASLTSQQQFHEAALRSLPRTLPLPPAPCPIPVDAMPRLPPRSPYLTAPASPLKATKSFDFRMQSPKLSLPPVPPVPEPPRHSRSLSSSEAAPRNMRKVPTRSRLRSDSQFVRDDQLVDSGIDQECSPLGSPCPVIPPPTPFAEPPAVPARPPHTLKPFPNRIVGNRRTDSFTSAVTHSEMEMQPLNHNSSATEATYDCVYNCAAVQRSRDTGLTTHVVEVDVHASEICENGQDSLYDRPRLLNGGIANCDASFASAQAVHNQMYFDLKLDEDHNEPISTGHLRNGTVKSAKTHITPKLVSPIAPSHPLAMYSTTNEQSPGTHSSTNTANGIPQNSGFAQLHSAYTACGQTVPFTKI